MRKHGWVFTPRIAAAQVIAQEHQIDEATGYGSGISGSMIIRYSADYTEANNRVISQIGHPAQLAATPKNVMDLLKKCAEGDNTNKSVSVMCEDAVAIIERSPWLNVTAGVHSPDESTASGGPATSGEGSRHITITLGDRPYIDEPVKGQVEASQMGSTWHIYVNINNATRSAGKYSYVGGLRLTVRSISHVGRKKQDGKWVKLEADTVKDRQRGRDPITAKNELKASDKDREQAVHMVKLTLDCQGQMIDDLWEVKEAQKLRKKLAKLASDYGWILKAAPTAVTTGHTTAAMKAANALKDAVTVVKNKPESSYRDNMVRYG